MNWPTSQDYNEAVQDPPMSFTDPALKGGEVVTNAMGLPVPRSGNFADVYQFKGADGKPWALKCFTRKVPGLRERYAKIDEHVRKARLPFTVGFQFFEKGVQVRGEWYPLLKMEWVEGFTLNDFVSENLGKPHYLHALIQMWAKLSGRLRDANMAHADLQHGNVLLVPGATPQKLGLKLIDYDGMWVPALAEFHSGEVGHPNFQHPLRLKEKLYNGDVDRFPHLAIAAGLRAALVGGKPLWDKFDNGDNLFFKEADFRNPAAAPVFKALWELNDPVLRTLVGHIALSSRQPLRKTPWLDDVLLQEGGPRLSAEDERQVCELLGVTAAAPAVARAATSAAVEQEFNVFQFLDEDEGPAERSASLSRTRKKPPPAKKKSNAPLLIGAGAVAGLLVVGVFAAVLLIPGRKDRPTEVAQNHEKEPESGSNPGGGVVTPKKEPPAPPPAVDVREELRQSLADTKWNWGDGTLELKANGSVYHPVWNEQFRLTTRWEPLDRRTAALMIETGRKQNQLAVLEFAEDLGSFVGFDFGSAGRMLPRPRVGSLAKPPGGGPPAETKQDLQPRLAGSEWEWGGPVRLRLKGDGSAEITRPKFTSNWAARWEPIDRRTAVVLVQGKAYDRVAVIQFSEDLREMSGYDFANPTPFVGRKRLDAGAAPSPSAGAVVAVSPLAGGKDFVFARKDDPTLYMTTNGSGRQAKEAGRADSPLTTLASASDGSKAVTGGADGEVRFWTFPGPRASLGRRLLGYDRIELFQDRFGIDSYDQGVVFRENATGKEEVVPAGKPGPAPAATFARTLSGNEKLARDLGPAVTDETKLYDGALSVQVFAGGVMCHSTTVNKSWWAWHGRRRPDADGVANPAVVEIASKVAKEHTGPVVACAVSFDGTRAVTLGRDRQLCEWDVVGAKLIRKFEVPDARAVAYLPGGKTVLLGTETGSAGVWDLDAKSRTLDVEASTVPIRAVCVSPRSDLAWTGAENGKIHVWSVPDFKPVHTISTEQQPVSALAVSADGLLLAVASPAGQVRYFNAKTGGPLGGAGGKLPVNAVSFLPGGHKVAAAWGLEPTTADAPTIPKLAGKDPLPPPEGPALLALVQEADAGDRPPQRMGYRPDGKYLWMSRGESLTVADGATGREVKTLSVGTMTINAAFGPGSELYVVLSGGRFQAWDWEKGERLRDLDPAEAKGPRPFQCWPLPTPNRLLITTNSPEVLVWDTAQWRAAERLTPYPTEAVTRVAPYPGGGRFAAVVLGREGQRAVVWDVREKREVFRLEGVEVRTLIHLEVSPGGKWVVGLSRDKDDGRVIVWNGQTGMHAHTISGVRPTAIGGAFSPGGDYYLHSEQAGRRWAVHLPEGKLTDETRGQRPSVHGADASTANRLATVDVDRKLRIWKFEIDIKPADPVTTPDPGSPTPPSAVVKEGFIKDSPDLSGPVMAAGVSADGKKVFALTQTGTLHVLDAATGAETAKHEVTKAKPIHMSVVPKFVHPSSGVAIPDRVHVLDADRHLHAMDAEKGTKIRDVNLEKFIPVQTATSRVVVTPLETHVMIFDMDKDQAYSWASGRWGTASIPSALSRPPFNTGTRMVAFSTDGLTGAGYAGGKLIVWRTRGGRDIRQFDSVGGVQWLAVAGEAGVVAVSDGGNLRAWKFDTGAEVMNAKNTLGLGRDSFAAATASGLVTAGGSDRSLKVWDLKTGKEAARYPLEQLPAGVAVSPDGRTAAVWYESSPKVGLWALPAPKGK